MIASSDDRCSRNGTDLHLVILRTSYIVAQMQSRACSHEVIMLLSVSNDQHSHSVCLPTNSGKVDSLCLTFKFIPFPLLTERTA